MRHLENVRSNANIANNVVRSFRDERERMLDEISALRRVLEEARMVGDWDKVVL